MESSSGESESEDDRLISEMESSSGESEDERPIVLTNRTSQKRQRSPTERTATLLDLDVTDCPICFNPLTIPIFQVTCLNLFLP